MTLTLAITVFNRYSMLLESFANVIDDPRIDEILISDDCSELEYWNKIKELPKFNPKIKVVRQLENRGMSVNKRDAVFNSKNDWVIIGDSDNVFNKQYFDAIEREGELVSRVIYMPSFARPNFDYRKCNKIYSHKMSMMPDLNDAMTNCLFNTCNYLVNKEQYLKVWEENKTVSSADTIWFNYLWLKAGNCFSVVPGMEYEHRVHPGSSFLQDIDYNMKKSEEFKNMIQSL